jgi:dihydrofolate synthase / folylpolyglutamate synthase
MTKKFTYTESISYLYNLQKFGMKFGLYGIQQLLKCFDNPENKFRSIHIAGTNGKGSTASMIASIFIEAGYKTGLYTSPHIVSFNERIRINGEPISSRSIASFVSDIYPEVEKNNSTFFEVATAIAFKYFADSNVDIAIIETGLGGRLDATNVLRPMVSVITSIGLEHTEILGDSIEKIAVEKAGIIKPGIPCVSRVRSPDAVRVLRKVCTKNKSKFISVRPNKIRIRKSSLEGLLLDFSDLGDQLKNVSVSLLGEHQAGNAALAIKAVEVASEQSDFIIDTEAIRNGLRRIQQNTGILARFSLIKKKPLIIADVAHNPEAIRTLRKSLQKLFRNKINIVIGLMKDKDHRQIVKELKDCAKNVYAVAARTERSRPAIDLVMEFQRYGVKVCGYKSVADGLKSALADRELLLITGSHFVVGEAYAFVNKEKYLTINQ